MKIPEAIYFVPQLVPDGLQLLKQLTVFTCIPSPLFFSTIVKLSEP